MRLYDYNGHPEYSLQITMHNLLQKYFLGKKRQGTFQVTLLTTEINAKYINVDYDYVPN